MLSRSNWTILGLAVLAAAAGGYIQHRVQAVPNDVPAAASEPAIIGQRVPALGLSDLDGKPRSLDEYRGRRVLLNFWASWCAPCVEEMPLLAKVQQKFGERGSIVIGIAMDDPARVRAFLTTHPVIYPILMGEIMPPSTSFKMGDVAETLPYSVLIGEDGRILATHHGALTTQQAEQWLQH